MFLFKSKHTHRDDGDEIYDRLLETKKIESLYKPTLTKHFNLIETYEKVYSTALRTGIDSPLMDSVIQLCKEDIGLSQKLKEYCIALGEPLFTLPAYKRLAIIYTKRKQYEQAIEICDASIRIGNLPEEFKTRKSRLEEMKKKATSSSKALKS